MPLADRPAQPPDLTLIPPGRLGLAAAPAAAIAFLASSDASFFNGANLVFDGARPRLSEPRTAASR